MCVCCDNVFVCVWGFVCVCCDSVCVCVCVCAGIVCVCVCVCVCEREGGQTDCKCVDRDVAPSTCTQLCGVLCQFSLTASALANTGESPSLHVVPVKTCMETNL